MIIEISLGFKIFLQLINSARRAKAEVCRGGKQLGLSEVGEMPTADGAYGCCGALASGHQHVAFSAV